MAGSRPGRRRRLIAVVVATGVVVGGLVAAAAALTTRTKTEDVSSGTSKTAQARCPRDTEVVLGGFRSGFNDTVTNGPAQLTRLKRSSSRVWNAREANWDDSQDATVTSVAYCGHGGQLVERTNTEPVPTEATASATATCPRGDGVAFGGFSTSLNPVSINPEDFVSALKSPSKRTWRATVINESTTTQGSVTAIAYCHKEPTMKAVTDTVSIATDTSDTATATCPPDRRLAFGGFTADVTLFDAFVLPTKLVRASAGSWTAAAWNGGTTGDLTAIAYCK